VRFTLKFIAWRVFKFTDKKFTHLMKKAGKLESEEYLEYRQAMDDIRVKAFGKKPKR
jgi:hypothetical protein